LREWGTVVPGFAALLVGVTVPHLLITPFWDVSSHVLYAVAPAGYLFLVDRRFVPLVVVGLGMVVARPLARAHTWTESIGGLVLASVFLIALFWTGWISTSIVDDQSRLDR
jgi:membrane-associated phospholipid phosphatase